MPAFHLFGQRTFSGGDDIRCLALLSILLYFLQFCITIPLLGFIGISDSRWVNYRRACQLDADTGQPPGTVKNLQVITFTYLLLSLIYTFLSFGMEIMLWKASSIGTPTQPGRRTNKLKYLCSLKWSILAFYRAILGSLGIIVADSTMYYCTCNGRIDHTDNRVCTRYIEWLTLLWVLIVSHWSELLLSVAVILYIVLVKLKVELWQAFRTCCRSDQCLTCCCRCCCRFCCTFSSLLTCCCFGGIEANVADLNTISLMLADYVDNGGTLDIVVSDIVAGLVMLVRVQNQRRIECQQQVSIVRKHSGNFDNSLVGLDQTNKFDSSEETICFCIRHVGTNISYESIERSLLTPLKESDVFAIAEGARFMRLALAIYTWKMQIMNDPLRGCCRVCQTTLMTILGCNWCSRKRNASDPCGWHEGSLRDVGRLATVDIIYASYSVGVVETPYCITLDHEWTAVVLVIRGSLSLEDFVADLTMHPASLRKCGDRCRFDGQGYAHAGMLAIAEWIFSDLESHGMLEKIFQCEKYREYRLVITGHSLGAGCASLLSLMLHSRYSHLRCLCFSPPGCVISDHYTEKLKGFVVSYVLDLDIVPRLSLTGMEHLRDDILEMIARIKVSKYDALKPCKKSDIADVNRETLHQTDSPPSTEFRMQLLAFHRIQKTRKQERDVVDVPLYPPGEIIHLTAAESTDTTSKCNYTAIWKKMTDLREIEISQHMLRDHHPHRVLQKLEQMAAIFGLSPPYLPKNFNKAREDV